MLSNTSSSSAQSQVASYPLFSSWQQVLRWHANPKKGSPPQTTQTSKQKGFSAFPLPTLEWLWKFVSCGLENSTRVHRAMLKTALWHRVTLTRWPSGALRHAAATGAPEPEKRGLRFTTVHSNKRGHKTNARLLTLHRMYNSQSRRREESMAMVWNDFPCVTQGRGNTVCERKLGEENTTEAHRPYLFDQSSLYEVLLGRISSCSFWKGEWDVFKGSVHWKKGEKLFEDLGGNSSFMYFPACCHIALFFHCPRWEKSTQKKFDQTVSREPLSLCTSSLLQNHQVLTGNHSWTSSYCSFLVCLFLRVVSPEAAGSHEWVPRSCKTVLSVHGQSYWVSQKYLYPIKIITFIHGTLWTYVSLCKPSYTFCTFVLFIEYKNRSPLKFCLSSLKNYLFVKFSYKPTASTWK